jgi:CheY-like chemotaxis protein
MPPLARVLVVEDEPDVAGMLEELLVDLGYGVKIALSGQEALGLAPAYRPDAVLLDLNMSGLPGTQVLEQLLRVDPLLPVIIVTGNSDLAVALSTLKHGAFDYVSKPFDLHVLERIVAAAVSWRVRAGPESAEDTGVGGAPGPTIEGTDTARAPRTVLYIEDNAANVRLVERLLEQRPGLRLLSANLGQLGLALAREHRPEMILLDLHLPDIEGEDLLRAIRSDEDLRGIPIVILSGEAHAGLPEQMLAAGARGFLLKPLNFQQFFAEVDAVLGRIV